MSEAKPLQGKTPAQSFTTQVQIVSGADLNGQLILFGGALINWMDICGAFAARRHAEGPVVTVGMDDMHFYASARADESVVLEAKLIYAGKTSMEVFIRVFRENYDGSRLLLADGREYFVALDENRHPRAVPPLLPQTEEEIADFEASKARRAAKKG